MNKLYLAALLCLICIKQTAAQHCPFDGSSIVVIKLTDSTVNPITKTGTTIYLTEKPNALADSCTYATGQLNLAFGSPEINLIKKYTGTWEERAALYLTECIFNRPGYYVVVLNQAQRSCMVDRNNQFSYIKRQFEIRQKNGEGYVLLTDVPADRIYSLCTSSGTWTRIQAIEIILAE